MDLAISWLKLRLFFAGVTGTKVFLMDQDVKRDQEDRSTMESSLEEQEAVLESLKTKTQL